MNKRTVALLAAALFAGGSQVAYADTINVQSTTDTRDAGLVNGIADPASGDHIKGLLDLYAEAHPEDTINYVPVGTGVAIENAKNGQGDVLITHAPTLEQQFVDGGFSVGLGRQIFYSDYVIVGPLSDPAGVAANARHDAVTAYEDIATRGDGEGDVTFVSRAPLTGSLSGTATQEQIIWGLTDDAKVPKHASPNTGATAGQKVPDATDWYKQSNAGQAENVNRTSQCAADDYPQGGCYTMVDRGTFNNLVNDGTVTNLKIVSDVNDAAARGGKDLLINPFSTYVVKQSAVPGGDPAREVAAKRFVDFIVSQSFQSYLPEFPNAIDPAFRPDAYPTVTLDSPLPQAAATGAALTVAGTAANQLPGAVSVNGMSVTLQRSTDGGTSWSDVASAPTDANGHFSIPATVSSTAAYRIATPDADVAPTIGGDPFVQLTAHQQGIGSVTATPAGGGGTTPPPPGGGTTPDKKKPAVSKVKLTAKRISVRVSEASTVKVTIKRRVVRRVDGKKRTSFKTVKRVTIKAKKAGTVRHKIKRLKPGTYRIQLRVTDTAGNRRTATVSRKLKR